MNKCTKLAMILGGTGGFGSMNVLQKEIGRYEAFASEIGALVDEKQRACR